MAGDWIKMRVDLFDDPAVVSIAAACDLSEDEVVGKLLRVWSWANRHTEDGHAKNVTLSWIDRYVSVTGFATAMQAAGWLAEEADGVTIPNFDRHNGKSAKKRAEDSERQRKKRLSSREERDKCHATVTKKARPEKRREEVNTELPSEASGESASPASPPPPPPEPSKFRFLVKPSKGKPDTLWVLPQREYAKYAAVYGEPFTGSELGKAELWLSNNAPRRKTAGGMLAFLTNWLNRATNSSGGARGSPRQPVHHSGPGYEHDPNHPTQNEF